MHMLFKIWSKPNDPRIQNGFKSLAYKLKQNLPKLSVTKESPWCNQINLHFLYKNATAIRLITVEVIFVVSRRTCHHHNIIAYVNMNKTLNSADAKTLSYAKTTFE